MTDLPAMATGWFDRSFVGSVVLLSVSACVGLITLVVVVPVLVPWIRTVRAGAPIPLFNLAVMRLQKANVRLIVREWLRVREEKLPLSIDNLAAHGLTSGDVAAVVDGVILTTRAGLDPREYWLRLSAMDLAGLDVRFVVRAALDARDPRLININTSVTNDPRARRRS